MVSKKWFGLCVLGLSIVPSLALADDPPAVTAKKQVEEGLVKPLDAQDHERSLRPSRERRPPAERRVRVTQAAPAVDAKGGEYFAFAVDVRYGKEWRSAAITGCVYPKTSGLFVKLGDEYRPAAFMLGKDSQPVTGVCAPGSSGK